MARSLLTLQMDSVTAMLNCEFTDHPVYDGLELQWFDDARHGTGMLVFLSRRSDRSVDYYLAPGLALDRANYRLGGGSGSWTPTDFDLAHLQVHPDGVVAHVRFTDVDGRLIEVDVDDRDGRPRRPAGLLAPVGAGISDPDSLLLVWMPAFDLVRTSGRAQFRIDGQAAATGRLPAARLHRRLLVKYAAPLVTASLARTYDGPLDGLPGVRSTAPAAELDGHTARVELDPGMPDPTGLASGVSATGAWWVMIDDVRLTGGKWSMMRDGEQVTVELDVTERWRPGRLPALMRVVTTLVPVFRRWPTTYRWRGQVTLGTRPWVRGHWERTGTGGGEEYQRRTQG